MPDKLQIGGYGDTLLCKIGLVADTCKFAGGDTPKPNFGEPDYSNASIVEVCFDLSLMIGRRSKLLETSITLDCPDSSSFGNGGSGSDWRLAFTIIGVILAGVVKSGVRLSSSLNKFSIILLPLIAKSLGN